MPLTSSLPSPWGGVAFSTMALVCTLSVFNGFFDNVENYDALVSYDEKNVRLRICDDKGNQVHKVIWNYHSEKEQVIRIAGIERNYIISFCWGE